MKAIVGRSRSSTFQSSSRVESRYTKSCGKKIYIEGHVERQARKNILRIWQNVRTYIHSHGGVFKNYANDRQERIAFTNIFYSVRYKKEITQISIPKLFLSS